MTQPQYITRTNAINKTREIQRQAEEQREAAELVTPFTTTPGTPIVSVNIMRTPEPDEVKIALTLPGGAQEVRCMFNRRHTHELVMAYGNAAERGVFVESGVNWSNAVGEVA